MKEEKYAIKKKDGSWLVTPNYHNNGNVICLYTKEMAQKQIEIYYPDYKVAKIIK